MQVTPKKIVFDEKTVAEWTLLKEIFGTFIGVAPFIIALLLWGSTMNERMRVVEVRIEHTDHVNQQQDQAAKEQRQELLSRLDRLSTQIEILQQTVAKQNK